MSSPPDVWATIRRRSRVGPDVGRPDDHRDEIEGEIVAWHNETETLLPSEFRSFFEGSAGMTSFTSQYKDYSRISNHLIGRLTRPGEIIGKI
jgi:hypothetical protein